MISPDGVKHALELYEESHHIEQITKRNAHYYDMVHEGMRTSLFPSPTTYLGILNKPALMNWSKKLIREALQAGASVQDAMKAPDVAREEAAEHGNLMHNMMETYVNTNAKIETKHYDEFMLMHDFLSDMKITAIRAEFKVFHKVSSFIFKVITDKFIIEREPGYGGTVDLIGVQNQNELTIVDWKTGGIWDTHKMQLAAYAKALEEMIDIPVKHAYVYSTKTQKFEQADIDHDYKRFCAIAAAYDAMNPKKNIYQMACKKEKNKDED